MVNNVMIKLGTFHVFLMSCNFHVNFSITTSTISFQDLCKHAASGLLVSVLPTLMAKTADMKTGNCAKYLYFQLTFFSWRRGGGEQYNCHLISYGGTDFGALCFAKYCFRQILLCQ